MLLADYLLSGDLWKDLLPIPLFAALIALVLSIMITRKKDEFGKYFIVLFAMSLVGIVAGQLTGQSRDPVVGSVVPAVLGIIGGLFIYLIGVKEQQSQIVVALSVIALFLNLLVGVFWGSHVRSEFNSYLNSREYLLYQEQVRHDLALEKIMNDKKLKKFQSYLESHPEFKNLK